MNSASGNNWFSCYGFLFHVVWLKYMTYLEEILDPNLLNGDYFLQSGNLLGYPNSNGATTAQNIFWISLKNYFYN